MNMDDRLDALAREALSYSADQRLEFLHRACPSTEVYEAVCDRIAQLQGSDEAAESAAASGGGTSSAPDQRGAGESGDEDGSSAPSTEPLAGSDWPTVPYRPKEDEEEADEVSSAPPTQPLPGQEEAPPSESDAPGTETADTDGQASAPPTEPVPDAESPAWSKGEPSDASSETEGASENEAVEAEDPRSDADSEAEETEDPQTQDGPPVGQSTTQTQEEDPSADSFSTADLDAGAGRVGPWRLVEPLGRGGMGTVYKAERADGQFQQQAALKLIRHDLGPEAQKRFLSERQILAQLQHPNIAHLLDGGVTDDGRPYFAMEYVRGTPIDRFCNQHDLGVEERLRLFQQVCEAVQFAHSNLVVHRDLKPANILVAEPETQTGTAVSEETGTSGFMGSSGPQVKLLDFGIAKALEGAEGIDSYTQTGEGSPLTPSYAAPEQVTGESITTATDVYAMGIVLCELLTGCLPYDVRGRSPVEVTQVITETEPTRLSELVVETPDTEVVAACGRSPEALKQRLTGDLDVIVQKALRKEPDRRYTSATNFGQDVDRHLEGLPVEARPATTGYRLRRFVERNRTAVMSAAGAFVALLLGLGVAIWQAQVAASERDRAQQLAEEAQQNAERAEAAQTFLVDMIGRAAPATTGGEALTMREVLDEAEAELESAMQNQPEVSVDVRRTVADMYFILDDADTSVENARKAYETGVEELGAEHPLTLKAAGTYGKTLRFDGQLERADSLYSAVVPRLETADVPADVHAFLLSNYGELLVQLPRLDKAERVLHRALDWSDRMEEPDTSQLSRALNALGGVYRRQERLDKAEDYYQRTLALVKGREGGEQIHSYTLGSLGKIYKEKGDYGRAEKMLRRGVAMNKTLYGEESIYAAASLENLSRVLRPQGKLEEADSVSARAVEIMREVYPPDDYRIGFGLTARMKVLQAQGRLDEASRRGEEAIELLESNLGPRHPYVIEPRTDLAAVYLRKGDVQKAARHAEKALEGYRARSDSTTAEIAGVMSQLGAIRTEQGRYEAAEDLLLEARSAQNDSAAVAKTRERLSDLYEVWSDSDR